MTAPSDISPEDGALAAEYALGLMDADSAAAFRLRVAGDTALAAEVVAWEIQFAAMAEAEVAQVAPPPALHAALRDRLFGDAPAPFWRRLGVWQGISLLGGVSTAALAALLWLQPVPPGPVPQADAVFVAQLQAESGDDLFLAVYDSADATLRLRRAGGDARPGRAQELWLIAGDAAPVSLGLLAPDSRAVIAVPEGLRAALTGGLLAISDEPPGGSPTGAPTGDVLAAGAVTEI